MATATSSRPVVDDDAAHHGFAARVSREIGRLAFGPIVDVMATREPSRRLAVQRYRAVAPGYDHRTAVGQPYREMPVARLAPAPGSVVLDVGCGTGLNFDALEDAIGPPGRLIGIDLSSEMLACARERVEHCGWQNVTLIEAAVEDAAIPVSADAALLSAVHDILRSPAALDNVVNHVRPGGRVVAAGPKWVPWWWPASFALNSCAWLLNRQYVTTFEGFGAPWTHLAALLPDLTVEEMFFGAGYVAIGTRPVACKQPVYRSMRRRHTLYAANGRHRREPCVARTT
jgi:demethylmenaquinone methyltransferase/2-methoxy-6-polyprenyl-1,4-benzoquinol methylase